MNIIETLNTSISHPPEFIQVAIKGSWEETWNIPYEQGSPSLEAIKEYIEKGTEAIAFEIFFKTYEGYDIILGIRFTDHLLPVSPQEFLTTSFKSIWSAHPPTLSSIILKLSETLTGNPNNLFSVDPTSVELGVINYWKSLGSIEMWKTSQNKKIQREILKKQLKDNPHLLQNNKNYTAMELNYRVSPHYWVGIQVADKQGEKWQMNEARLENLLSQLLTVMIV